MPRLSVRDDKPTGAAPLSIKVSGAAFLVYAGAALVWFFGIDSLHEWLAIDTACGAEPSYGRRARLGELVACSLAAGPKGWVFLAWCASLPLFTIFWMERALRRSIKARADAARDGSENDAE